MEIKQHPQIPHATQLRDDAVRDLRGTRGMMRKANDWAATELGLIFGSVWIVWVFFIWPLIALHMGSRVETQTSYYAQSWIQLFALPLFVYIGNKLQRSSDAQSDAMAIALSHIATIEDQNTRLLQQNTDLTVQIHRLVGGVPGQPPA